MNQKTLWLTIVYNSYNEAMATIRRVPGFDHHFNLVITRVFDDGDQELLYRNI